MLDIYYQYMPFDYHPTSTMLTDGNNLISKGELKLVKVSNGMINQHDVRRGILDILNGYSCLYGISYHKMIKHVFGKHLQNTAHNSKMQLQVLLSLGKELRSIKECHSFSDTKYHKYAKHVHVCLSKAEQRRLDKSKKRRLALSKLCDNKAHIFTGSYLRSGISRNKMLPTMLIGNLRHDGKIVTDHIWTIYDQPLRKMGKLKRGYKIQILAKVHPYRKLQHPAEKSTHTLDYGIPYVQDAMLIVPFYKASPWPLPDDSISMAGEIMVRHRKLTKLKDTSEFDIASYFHWQNNLRTKAEKI